MLKSWRQIAATLLVLGAAASSRAQALGPDALACRPGAAGPAALVRVYGFKDRAGQLRVQLYPGNSPDTFLDKGTKLKRIQMPVTPGGDMDVCVALPHVGEFAIAVLHDRNSNGKMNPTVDGVGFSRNPKLGLSKPDEAEAAFVAKPGVQVLDVVLNYMHGFSVKPLVPVRG